MQSSSQLFPVALISAEIRGDLSEDVYRLKPGNSPDASVELALTRLGRFGREGERGVPVVLLPGSFSNRRFWYSPKGVGLGPYLARAGFDVWIAEMRGHGLSPRNRNYSRNRVSDYVRFDLPAIADFIHEQNPQVAHWLGHSLGGITLAGALGGRYLDEARVASVSLFGSQISRIYWPLKLPPVEWGGRLLLGRFSVLSGSRLRRGPEDEPIGLALESLRWHGLFGRFGDAERDWWAGLREVRVPLLAVAAAGDRQDPAWACRKLLEQCGSEVREFLCLGREHGFSSDFDHVQMLVSKVAQTEVWPLVEHWLGHRSLRGTGVQSVVLERRADIPTEPSSG
ncbi:alpha/beta fold hydrolase [Pseudomonas benzenivorans]|uniref:Alpha/beta fold hydrolase n=1 Tax=Pseudomonas benzenivorans TaxID=556533 RepID=A0ABY5H6F7_9PSED|nr:alpha/beta fold hydrolase [Pseudomonas benzenivorans]UTW07589.1 alpha/beta fold hydrolase [Pseudomonas benzenivorans]